MLGIITYSFFCCVKYRVNRRRMEQQRLGAVSPA
jgi:hypothetical protein